MNRSRGRPRRETAGVSPDDILREALDLLRSAGIDGFTMRALAARMQLNPMTIYHHFGDRDGLISAMADRVYAGVSETPGGTVRARLESLLRAYHAEVLRHPDLTLLIFSRPPAFPSHARRITEDIARLLVDTGLTTEKSRLWVSILVDFTHGAAIATAMANRSGAAPSDDEEYDYGKVLAELMS